ncbi:hypothetical protein C0992_000162 [Termitomyces sp. T32_za158]|nr:hypothetical protein C0992_000162 [Termitomyces sp. T32_za158]
MASKPRINLKLSAKHVDPDAGPQPAKSDPHNRRKAKAKRLVLSDDEGIHDRDRGPADATTSTSPSESLTQRSHTLALEDSGSELTEPEPEPEPEPELSPLSQPSSTNLKRSKGRKPSEGPPAKKKRIHRDASSDEEFHTSAPSEDDTTHLVIPTKRQPKLTAKAKASRGKNKTFTVGAREERKAGRTQQSNSTETSQKAKTKRMREAEDEPVDVVNDAETIKTGTRSPSPPKEPAPPPAKRHKYPTIKKNKVAGATTDPAPAPSLKTSSNAVTKSTATATKAPDILKPNVAGSRVPPMMVGNADFDLRDESVYKALFNQSGGSTPRSGLARQKKDEERRKELNKMRDEARAKRLSEMTPSFNLQAQYERIKRFEETLGRRCSFPNVLAAKWRDIYEKRKAVLEETQSPGGDGGEEGQMRAHTDLGG